jgi:hypothetical protein
MSDQRIGSAIHRCIEHHFAVRVRKLRAPSEANLHGLDRGGERRQYGIDLRQTETRRFALFRPFQHVLVFEKQRWSRKRYQPAFGHHGKQPG